MRDARARAKLEIRFRRVSMGIFGDFKPISEGVMELREDIGLPAQNKRPSSAHHRGQSGSGSITSDPNQRLRVLSAIGDNCWVKRSASRRFGLEQAT